MRFFLGIDLGLTMGIARIFTDGTVHTHSPRLKSEYIARMCSLRDIIKAECTPDCLGVAIEKPFGNFRGMDVMQGMLAVASLAADDAGVPWTHVHLMTVKKHATGKGNAKKLDMQAAALKRWGVSAGEDEADALHICAYAMDKKLYDQV